MVHVKPGKTYKYTYNIPTNHHPGTYWYHPHNHGSVTLQVGGGALGMLIIDDDK
jgi:FtsP/CotA-like multicopper oxidase with cupredoxin domain